MSSGLFWAEQGGAMPPRLGYTILYVDDVARAASFYASAFGFAILEVEASPGWAMVDAGGSVLGFSSHALMARFYPSGYVHNDPTAMPGGFELDIVVDDTAELDRYLASAIEHGATLVEAARVADDGATVAFLRDPNGVIIEIQTPYRGPPP
jgi:catechol 2,3-dioxygenase-like lactoylglutathione lyase family enzyme